MSYGSIYRYLWIGHPSTGTVGSVATFNDLPLASEHTGQFWNVAQGSGGVVVAGRRFLGKDPGRYQSDGTTWSKKDDTDASDIAIDPAQYDIITATNLRDGLKELASAVALNVNNRPTGIPVPWPAPISSMPAGYLHCNGQSVSRTTYSALFAVIGTSHGSVDANSFNVPDYRDMFLRGASDTRAVNTYQADALKYHRHKLTYDPGGITSWNSFAEDFITFNASSSRHSTAPSPYSYEFNTTDSEPNFKDTGDGRNDANFSTETRPKNKSVHWIIKT